MISEVLIILRDHFEYLSIYNLDKFILLLIEIYIKKLVPQLALVASHKYQNDSDRIRNYLVEQEWLRYFIKHINLIIILLQFQHTILL